MRTLALILVPFAVSACAGGSCERYSAALSACNDEFEANDTDGFGGPGEIVDCSIYSNPLFAPTADLLGINFDCEAEAYENADCSSDEGVAAASADANECY